MTETRSGFREPVHVMLVKPNAVAERHLRPEQAEAVDVFHRRAAAAPSGVGDDAVGHARRAE